MVAKKDYQHISVIALISAVMALPVLGNLRPAFWTLSVANILLLVAGSLAAFNAGLFISGLVSKKYPSFFRFSKYIATGAMNSLTDVGVLNLESALFQVFAGPLIIIFNVVSFAVAVTNSYFWSNSWVFKKEGSARSASEYARFLAVTASSVIINTAIVYVITTSIGAPTSVSGAAWENIAKLFAVPVSILWNYLGYKLFVFK